MGYFDRRAASAALVCVFGLSTADSAWAAITVRIDCNPTLTDSTGETIEPVHVTLSLAGGERFTQTMSSNSFSGATVDYPFCGEIWDAYYRFEVDTAPELIDYVSVQRPSFVYASFKVDELWILGASEDQVLYHWGEDGNPAWFLKNGGSHYNGDSPPEAVQTNDDSVYYQVISFSTYDMKVYAAAAPPWRNLACGGNRVDNALQVRTVGGRDTVGLVHFFNRSKPDNYSTTSKLCASEPYRYTGNVMGRVLTDSTADTVPLYCYESSWGDRLSHTDSDFARVDPAYRQCGIVGHIYRRGGSGRIALHHYRNTRTRDRMLASYDIVAAHPDDGWRVESYNLGFALAPDAGAGTSAEPVHRVETEAPLPPRLGEQ